MKAVIRKKNLLAVPLQCDRAILLMKSIVR
jgi:hypothetical protein